MTVSSTTNKSTYIADGIVTVFAYDYLLPAAADMFVKFDGVDQPSGWSVDGMGDNNGGDVTFSTAPANGVEVVLIREVEKTQSMDLQPYDPFPAETVEDAFDKLTLITQDQQEAIDRSLKVGPGQDDPGDLLDAIDQAVIDAEAAAAAAEASAITAAASSSNANDAATSASNSAVSAAQSAIDADAFSPVNAMWLGKRYDPDGGAFQTLAPGSWEIWGAAEFNRGEFFEVGGGGGPWDVGIPKSGWYKVTNVALVDGASAGVLSLKSSASALLYASIRADVAVAGAQSLMNTDVLWLSQNDTLAYEVTSGNMLVWPSRDTRVIIEYLGDTSV